MRPTDLPLVLLLFALLMVVPVIFMVVALLQPAPSLPGSPIAGPEKAVHALKRAEGTMPLPSPLFASEARP